VRFTLGVLGLELGLLLEVILALHFVKGVVGILVAIGVGRLIG